MAEIWTSPKSWTMKEILDSAKLNVQLRDNLDYLFKRPTAYNHFVATGSWSNASAGVIEEIPNTAISVPTETGRILIDFQMSIGDLRIEAQWDIYNATLGYYLSSRSVAPAARGIYNTHSGNSVYRYGVNFFGIDYDLTEGVSYDYYVTITSSTATEVYDTGSVLQILGGEF